MGASSPHFLRALHLVLEFAQSNEALELNTHSLMKRTIAGCIGVGDGHWGGVTLIGRARVSALYQRRVGDA